MLKKLILLCSLVPCFLESSYAKTINRLQAMLADGLCTIDGSKPIEVEARRLYDLLSETKSCSFTGVSSVVEEYKAAECDLNNRLSNDTCSLNLSLNLTFEQNVSRIATKEEYSVLSQTRIKQLLQSAAQKYDWKFGSEITPAQVREHLQAKRLSYDFDNTEEKNVRSIASMKGAPSEAIVREGVKLFLAQMRVIQLRQQEQLSSDLHEGKVAFDKNKTFYDNVRDLYKTKQYGNEANIISVVNQFARQKQITFAPDKYLEHCNNCLESYLPTIPDDDAPWNEYI